MRGLLFWAATCTLVAGCSSAASQGEDSARHACEMVLQQRMREAWAAADEATGYDGRWHELSWALEQLNRAGSGLNSPHVEEALATIQRECEQLD
jgi:hypothetical protein